jgi:hypothetical protein
MCDDKKCCERPDQLKGDPKDCSPEQIQKCHKSEEGHSCASDSKPE